MLLMTAELQGQPQGAYERGLEELYSGNRAGALETWHSAYQNEGAVDSRIGFEYIRVVTESGLREFYDQATELYYRSLIDASGADSRAAIRQEIDRMRPIIGEGIYRQWVSWWNDENRRLGPDMQGYWVQEDPTPALLSNERLIEHWLRIAEVKRRYTKNSNTVYGTDDRGLYYIRYGSPDRTKNGILTLQTLNISNWLQNQLNPYAERSTGEEPPYDRQMDASQQNELFSRLQDAIYEFHIYPEYELWFYESLVPGDNSPVLFIFGTDVKNGDFRKIESVEDFIPERAYNSVMDMDEGGIEFTRAGFTPALMLQMLYYEQLAQVDSIFNNRLNEIQDKVLKQDAEVYRGFDLSIRSESRDMLRHRAAMAPIEESTYLDRIPRIPFHVYQYRFLDENLEPYLLTYLESKPQEAFLIDYYRNKVERENLEGVREGENILAQFENYELIHTILSYDENWTINSLNEDKPELIVYRSAADNNPSRSLFRTEHSGRSQQSASVKLLNKDPDSETLFETPFSSELRGLNRVQNRLSKPLVNHPDSLEMGDLVLGYESEMRAIEPFSFLVANDAMIPFEETLVLHFEVYNLKRMEDATGFTRFDLTYRILPVEEDGTVRTDEAEFVLTLNFTNEERNVIEDLEIETADLSPGLYDLLVQVNDTETGQRKERKIRFEVIR